MFAPTTEDYHESAQKGKPRSPQSQGVSLGCVHPYTSLNGVPSGTSGGLSLDGDDPAAHAAPASSSRLLAFSSSTSNSISANLHPTNAVSAAKIPSLEPRALPGSVVPKPRSFSDPTSVHPGFASVMSIPTALNISIEQASLEDYKRVANTLLLAFEDDPFVNYILNTADIKKNKVSKSVYKKKKLDLMLAYFEYSVYECLSTKGKVFVVKDNTTETLLDDMGMAKKLRFPYLGVSLWNHIYGPDLDTGYSSSGSLSESDEDMSDDEYFATEKIGFRDSIHPSYFKFNIFAILGNCRSKILKDKLPFLTKVRNKVLIDQLIKKENKNLNIWYLGDIATLPSMRGKGLGKIMIQYVINEYINKLSSMAYVYLESSNPVNRKFYSKLGFEVMTSYSIKYNKYVDSNKVIHEDSTNSAVNMDAMVFFPESATISPPKI